MTAMICPSYIPGETVYSWVAQYHLMSPYCSWKQVNRKLFGTTNVRLNPVLPSHVREVAAAARMDPHRLLNLGTAYPLVSLGLQNTAQINVLRQAMLESGGMNLGAISRQASSKLNFGIKLKCCSSCIDEDERRYGVGYWHTVHQLHGVTVCPVHKIRLSAVRAGEGGVNHSYILPDSSIQLEQSEVGAQEIYLSCFIADLYSYLAYYSPCELLRARFVQHMESKGYITAKGQLRWQSLKHDLIDFWGGLFEGETSTLPLALSSFQFVPRLAHHNVSMHYIKPVLLMAFLADSPKTFYGQEFRYHKAPLVQLNIANKKPDDRYALGLLRDQVSLRKVSKEMGCSVGYLKQLALRNQIPMQRRRKRISADIERSIWRQAFMGYHRGDIAKNHRVSAGAVESIIQSHKGLSAWRRHLRFIKKMRTCRDALLDYLAMNPRAPRNQIKKECGCSYMWLYRYDKKWLYKVLPSRQKYKYYSRVNWGERDSE